VQSLWLVVGEMHFNFAVSLCGQSSRLGDRPLGHLSL